MTRVVIQPSYGNPEARRHWADTLDHPVPFAEGECGRALPAEQRAELLTEHPDGMARFWGTTDKHDRRMDLLTAGDTVLLTGQKHVRAVGEVGHSFRNHEFARRIWTPDPRRCLWSNVYSLRVFRPTWIRYEEVWALPGFNAGDNFMGLRLLDEAKAATVLAWLAEQDEHRVQTP